MAMTYATISGYVTYPGSDDPVRGTLVAFPQTRAGALRFEAENRVTLGPVVADIDEDNDGHVELKIPLGADVTGLVWRLVVSPAGAYDQPWEMGTYEITQTAALASLESVVTIATPDSQSLGAMLSEVRTLAASVENISGIVDADTAVAYQIDNGPETQARLSASIASEVSDRALLNLGQYEAVPVEFRGDSWLDPFRTNTRTGASIGQRVSSRTRAVYVDRAASSRTLEDLAYHSLGGGPYAYVPSTRNPVVCASTHLNNAKYLGTAAPAERGYKYAAVSLLARLAAMGIVPSNTAAFTYDSTWATETTQTYTDAPTGISTPAQGTVLSTGGKRWRTNTVGGAAYVNATPNSGRVDLVFIARTGGAGVHTVRDATTNAVLGSIDLTAPVAQETPATLRLTGLGSATRNLKVELTSASSMTLDSLSVPHTTSWHPTVVFAPAPDVIVNSNNTLPAGDPASSYHAAQALFRAWLASCLADFPAASIADMLPDESNWPAELFNSDGRHLNDQGASQFAALVIKHLAGLGYRNGATVLSSATPPVYAPPTAPAVPANGFNGAGLAAPATYAGASHEWTASNLTVGTTPSELVDWVAGANLTSSGTAAPVVAQAGSLKYLHFDGVDDTLSNLTLARPAAETIAMLVRLPTAPTSTRRYMLSGVTATTTSTAGVNSGLTNWLMNDGATVQSSVAVDTAWHVIVMVRNGANSVYRIGATETAGNAGTAQTVTGVRVARAQTGADTSSTAMDLARLITFERVLSSTERDNLVAALTAQIPA